MTNSLILTDITVTFLVFLLKFPKYAISISSSLPILEAVEKAYFMHSRYATTSSSVAFGAFFFVEAILNGRSSKVTKKKAPLPAVVRSL